MCSLASSVSLFPFLKMPLQCLLSTWVCRVLSHLRSNPSFLY